MGLYILFQRYLDSQNDQRFMRLWEKYVILNLPRFIVFVFTLYIAVMVLIGYLISIPFGFILTLFLVVVIGLYIGYDLIVETFKFLAINNQRYLLVKSQGKSSDINYDNVVN